MSQREADDFSRILRQQKLTAAQQEGPQLNAFEAVVRRACPSPEIQLKRAVEWVDEIKRRVADPSLARFRDGRLCMGGEQILLRIANCVVDGTFPKEKLEIAFKSLEERQKAGDLGSRAAYFVGTIKILFARRGLEWR